MADLLPGKLALQSGDYDQARGEIAAALTVENRPELRVMQARVSMAENSLTDAEQTIRNVLTSWPENAEAHAVNGKLFAIRASRASIFRTGKYIRKAIAAYETALEYDPDSTEALIGMIRLRSSAPALFGGSYEEALAITQRLHKTDPVVAALETASIYKSKRDSKRHINELNTLIQSHPGDPRAWLELGFVEQSEQRWEPAHQHFKTALEAAKDHDAHAVTAQSARYQIGRTAVLSNANTESGIDALTDYLEGPRFRELPETQWAHYRRGLLHERLNQPGKARSDFTLAAETSDKDLKRALRGR